MSESRNIFCQMLYRSIKTQNLTHRIVKKLEMKETMSVPIILVYYTQKALKYNDNLMQCMCQHKTIDCFGSKHY